MLIYEMQLQKVTLRIFSLLLRLRTSFENLVLSVMGKLAMIVSGGSRWGILTRCRCNKHYEPYAYTTRALTLSEMIH